MTFFYVLCKPFPSSMIQHHEDGPVCLTSLLKMFHPELVNLFAYCVLDLSILMLASQFNILQKECCVSLIPLSCSRNKTLQLLLLFASTGIYQKSENTVSTTLRENWNTPQHWSMNSDIWGSLGIICSKSITLNLYIIYPAHISWSSERFKMEFIWSKSKHEFRKKNSKNLY